MYSYPRYYDDGLVHFLFLVPMTLWDFPPRNGLKEMAIC